MVYNLSHIIYINNLDILIFPHLCDPNSACLDTKISVFVEVDLFSRCVQNQWIKLADLEL